MNLDLFDINSVLTEEEQVGAGQCGSICQRQSTPNYSRMF